ncbi:PspC domain-containing protein [Sphingomonas crusticola]|uniref:PspC domain-containing protein n=1 Tax=Sphingomonas crusticola TaxID=1697973 RepID=UPI000E2873FF|nr:PspC domain-containing protein [Sphingomonas crusticola]
MTTQTAPQHDNLLGICHALGETFGFNPIVLRLAFLVGLVLAPEGSMIAYGVAGVAVLASKLLTRSSSKRPVQVLTHA